ncbi:MAG TPA: hypothetical protein VKA46_09555 [Gemmataceae bacterium]|nr:hypothetical protein [Gemmataceae bacterium]
MATKGGGESRAGLVVFLVLFVLLSISLGITTYLGYSEIDKEKKGAEEQKGKAAVWEKDANYWKFLALTYRSYLGLPATKDDPKTLVELRRQYEGGTLAGRDDSKEDHKKSIMELWGEKNPARKWDGTVARPAETYQQEIDRLTAQLKKAEEAAATAKLAEDHANATAKQREDEFAAAKKEYTNELTKQRKADEDEMAGLRQTVTKQQAELAALGEKALIGLDPLKADIAFLRKEKESLNKKLLDAIKTINKNRDEVARMQSAEEIDITKIAPENLARIVSINGSGDMPYINIGSADNLKRLVTFSIYGKGVDGKPLKAPKGKLEVIRVTGEHMAQARITELRDERRDPVLPGDFIFNPGWNPNLKQHVAVIGYIYLTGDKQDNTAEFVRALKNQNLEVDAWMEMKSLKMQGEITRQTDILIVGASPDFGTGPIKPNDAKADVKSGVLEAMRIQEKKAEELGVRIVRLNTFLEMSGYPLPKGLGSEKGKIDFHRNLDSPGSPIPRRDPQK